MDQRFALCLIQGPGCARHTAVAVMTNSPFPNMSGPIRIPGVNCQAETREELIAHLREALAEAIELNREDAKSAAGDSFEEIAILP